MNYFLISNMYPDESSPGYGVFVKNIVMGLKEFGLNNKYSALICGKPKCKIDKLFKYLKFYLKIILYFFYRYKFIYVHFPNQVIPLLYLLCPLKKVKIIINYHGEDLLYRDSCYARTLGKLTDKFVRKYATNIVVPSEYYKQIVVGRGLIESDRVIVSPSGGINKCIFYPSKNMITSGLQIGFVGRLQKDKGLITFIKACEVLKSKSIPFCAYIIGYGELSEWCKDYLTTNGLDESIKMLGGISQDKLGEYYRNMNLFVFPSERKTESLGLTGIEAMACGNVVIGSDIGGISGYIVNNFNGWLVPVGDFTSIANWMIHYYQMDTSLKLEMRRNCISSAREYYNCKVSKCLADIFISSIL